MGFFYSVFLDTHGLPMVCTKPQTMSVPVFVFAVSGLGAPASRRLTVGILTIQESTR
jgi:hypothetical protein